MAVVVSSPVLADLIPHAEREMALDAVAVGILGAIRSGHRALPLFIFVE